MNYDNSDSREISLKSQYGLEKAPNVTKDAMILQVLDNINTATVEKNNNGRYSGIIIRDRENTTSSGLIKPLNVLDNKCKLSFEFNFLSSY